MISAEYFRVNCTFSFTFSVCLGFICKLSVTVRGFGTCLGWNLFRRKQLSLLPLKWSKKETLGEKEIANRVLDEDSTLSSSVSTDI